MNNQRLQAHLALFAVATLYGINYSIVKLVTPAYIQPFGFIGIRILLACLIFWLLAVRIQDPINWKRDGLRLVLCGLTGVGINMLLFFKGISLTTATNGSLIMTLIPLFVFAFSLVLLKEQLVILRLTGLIVGLLGAGTIIWQTGDTLMANPLGDLMIVGNAMSFSLYLVLVTPLMDHYRLLTVTKWAFLIGLLFCLPFSAQEALSAEYASFPQEIWWSIAFVVIAVTVIVYFLNIYAMKKSSPTLVAAYAYLQPVVAILTASIFFDEEVNLQHLIGGVLIFVGIYMVSRFRPKPLKAK